MTSPFIAKSEYTNETYTIEIDLSRDELLPEASITSFKEDKYMLPGETSPQHALARASVSYASNQAHAQRLYDYVSKQWFMFASPVLASAGNARGCPVSCLAAGTPVITKSGFTEIQKLKTGDLVKTASGRFSPVLATKESYSEDVYKLVVDKRRTPLYVTGNHLIYTNEGWVRVDELRAPGHLVACDSNIELVSKPHTIKIENSNTPLTQFKREQLTTEVLVTEDLAWALGFWFAEGSVGERSVRVTNNDLATCQKWVDIVGSAFGLEGRAYSQNTWANGDICSSTLKEWFTSEFGQGCRDKYLTDWIVELPLGHLKCFYEGLYLGDGSKTTEYEALELTNPNLIAGIHNILLKLGRQHSLRLDKSTGSGNKSGIIILHRDAKRMRGLKFHDGLYYNPIISLEKIEGGRLVYDIQVANEPTFVAAGVVVHNCFLGAVGDSRGGLADSWREMLWLATEGGGVGYDYSAVRSVGSRTSRGTSTPGLMSFLGVADSITKTSVQGEVRRGASAIYVDVSHPEIQEFIECRKIGGDKHRKLFNLNNAVNITDAFMLAVEEGRMWDLIDPHDGRITETVDARALWDRILTTRVETGEPYLHFTDTSNRFLPQALKDKGLKINGSNLCNEIYLPTSPDRTAVCILSSVNLEYFDEWSKEGDFISDLIEMLDNVTDVFINKAPTDIENAIRSAFQERSIGLGAMGFHLYLQKKSVPFESVMASSANRRMFSYIDKESLKATHRLGAERGEAPDLVSYLKYEFEDGSFGGANSSDIVTGPRGKMRLFEAQVGDTISWDIFDRNNWDTIEISGTIKSIEGSHSHTGRRNSHRIAVAPNASSAILCGLSSPSIEPFSSNYIMQKKARAVIIQNKQLDKVLKEKYSLKGRQYDEAWTTILKNSGSVQSLPFMEQHDKDVFKTAREIDQSWIIEHASVRQEFICQGQSVNLFLPKTGVAMSYLRGLHKAAWKKGLKGLYYIRSENVGSMDGTSGKALIDPGLGCLSCSG